MNDTKRKALEEEFEKAAESIDKQHLRKLQRQAYRCASVCCNDMQATVLDVQRCKEGCFGQLTAAQQFVSGELNNFNQRLNRCQMDCTDKVKDQMSAVPSSSELDRHRGEHEKCLAQCFENSIFQLSHLLKRVKEYLESQEFQTQV